MGFDSRWRRRAALAAACALVLGSGAALAADAPPANDDFASAAAIVGQFGETSGSVAQATAEPGEPDHGDPVDVLNDDGLAAAGFPPSGRVAGSWDNPANHSVWFRWVAPLAGETSFSTAGSAFDTVLSVYVAHEPAQPAGFGNLRLVAGNDDCHTATGGTSCVRFPTGAGAVYWIAVDSVAASQADAGPYVLRWLLETPPPQNDSLSTAIVLPATLSTIVGSNAAATSEPSDPVVAGKPGGASVWYRWSPPAGTVTLGTGGSCTAPFDLLVGLFRLAAGGALEPVPGAEILVPRGQALTAAFVVDGGAEYAIVVQGLDDGVTTGIGRFCLAVTQTNGGDLNLDLRLSQALLHPGELVDYRLTLANAGPGPALGATVIDQLPPQLELVAAPDCCSVDRLDPGASRVFTLRARVSPAAAVGTSITNTASVASRNDPAPGNNSASATAPVEAAADLSVAKAAPAAAYVGETLTYTLRVANAGPNAATGVRLIDRLPGELHFEAPAGCTLGGATLDCDLGTLAAGTEQTITLQAPLGTELAGTTLTNHAIVGAPTFDPDRANNADTAQTTVSSSADVVVETVAAALARPGDTLTYAVTVSNRGPSPAEDVSVRDALPADLTLPFLAGDPRCSLDAAVVTCALGTLAAGASATFTVAGALSTTATGTSLVHIATATSATRDPLPGNNVAETRTTIVPDADLAVAATTAPVSVLPGGRLDYTFTVTNRGPGAARAVLTDVLPVDTTLASAGAGCSLSGRTLTCALGELAAGAGAAVRIGLDLAAGTNAASLSNTATVTSLDLNDVDPTNDSATVTTTVEQVGCPAAGKVRAALAAPSAKKPLLLVTVEADCRRDRRSGAVFLHDARLLVVVDGSPLIAAVQTGWRNDFRQVAITSATDAVVRGVHRGTPFTVTLHEGGKLDDTVRVQYGSYDSGTLAARRGAVDVRRD